MSSQIRMTKRGLAYRCLRCPPTEEAHVAEKTRMEAHIFKRHLALEVAPFFCTLCMYRCESLKALHKHVDTFMPHVNQRNLCITENRFRGDSEYLFASSQPHVFNAVQDFPDYEVLPALDSQRHWASKVRARPLATPTQVPVRAVALQATRPIQTEAPVKAASLLSTHHVQTKAPVRVAVLPATHPYPTGSSYHVAVATPQPSLQSRLGPPVCVGAASLRRLAIPVSPAVPSSIVDVPATTVRPAANQVMPLKSSSPMDDLYDFFMPDVTMTSIAEHSTTISSAISHYLPLETPTASTSLSPVTSANLYSTVPTTTTRTYQESSMRPETPMSTTCTSSPDQDPYSPEISPSVQYIFDQDLIQDEDAEYILPQILGSEAPQTSTPKPQPVVQTPPPSFAQPPTPNLSQQILTALSTFTTTKELLLKEIAHNTKSIQTLSTDIAYLRGQVRHFERVQGGQQTILDRLSNLSNRPIKPIRRKPYLNRPKPQQRQPIVKSVVEKKNADSKEHSN
ncbi:unnamed protein product [Mytilus coruscus]|uniref:Uncharacterized protein n=1 Tax=Mytilus coruscus TaxID=42192 RepID=A0A6J8D670_MYTCO|nr:unnamed protein product [Mytilus coruscus]